MLGPWAARHVRGAAGIAKHAGPWERPSRLAVRSAHPAGAHARGFAGDASDGFTADPSSTRGKAVVLSKRLPQDFIENTLLPHLESQLLDSIHIYSPAELAKIARTYSKQEVRQRALCVKLADTVKHRIVAFEAVDVVDILGALWILAPWDDELFEMLEQRILARMEDFTALNFMGIIRIFNKRASKHHNLLEKVIPRLRELLGNYEGVELSEMLVSMAQSSEAQADMDILMTLVPEIERRYSEVSLVHAINNVWALTQLRMVHQGLLSRVAQDLANSTKTRNLTPGYMARIAWVYRRCGAWDQIASAMLPLIRSTATEFRCGDFARLAQCLPEERQLLQQISDLLRPKLVEMGRKDFMLFLLGCVHGELLETPAAGDRCDRDPDSLTSACLQYARDEQDNFKRDEVQKLVYMLWHAKKYQPLLDELPASWNTTKQETVDYIRAKG